MGINCETVYGNPIDCNDTPLAETRDDCTLYVKYIYTVTSVGPTTENINSIYRTLNGNIKYLTSALDTTEIDIFQEETKISISAELDATLTSGTKYKDTSVYRIDVEKIFDVEVEAECVLADDINTDCH